MLDNISPKRFALICIILGSILRLIFPYDIEFKVDQKLMLDWVNEFWQDGHFRPIGMMSGGNVYNFGLGVWLFYLLGWLSNTPVGLTMVVAVINVFSLFFLYYIIVKKIAENQKDVWFYALSLLSVSILPIILSRDIWIQSILPPISFGLWFLYWSDLSKFKYAFLLGLLLVLIGQIHLSGIFLCFIVSIFLFYFHYRKWIKLHLKAYIIGGVLAALPMIPLFIHLLNDQTSSPSSSFDNMKDLRFLWFHIFDGLGLDIFYTLEADTVLFFKYAMIYGHHTYLSGVLYILLILTSLLGIFYSIKYGLKNTWAYILENFSTHKTIQLIIISLSLYTLLFVLRVRIFSHYFIITYPFIQLLAVYLVHRKKFLIHSLVLINLFLSILFMLFIHETGGTENSYYGITYQRMIMEGK